MSKLTDFLGDWQSTEKLSPVANALTRLANLPGYDPDIDRWQPGARLSGNVIDKTNTPATWGDHAAMSAATLDWLMRTHDAIKNSPFGLDPMPRGTAQDAMDDLSRRTREPQMAREDNLLPTWNEPKAAPYGNALMNALSWGQDAMLMPLLAMKMAQREYGDRMKPTPYADVPFGASGSQFSRLRRD